jgi:hypothetical protein
MTMVNLININKTEKELNLTKQEIE